MVQHTSHDPGVPLFRPLSSSERPRFYLDSSRRASRVARLYILQHRQTVEMLASIPHMETLRSVPRNPDVVARHPSAEDLDAAQQLISSAQGGREHPLDRHYTDNGSRKSEAGAPQSHHEGEYPIVQTSETPTNGHHVEKTSPKSQKDTSFLGHSCRLV